MLNQQTTDQLRALKLTGMLEAWEQQREQPQTHDLSFDERLALLVEREVLHRENRRLARLLKAAKLRVNAKDIDYRHPRGLEKARMADGQWRLDPPGAQPVHHRPHRLRQDLARLRAGQPSLPPEAVGALPAPARPVRAAAHRPRRRLLAAPDEPAAQDGPADPRRLGPPSPPPSGRT